MQILQGASVMPENLSQLKYHIDSIAIYKNKTSGIFLHPLCITMLQTVSNRTILFVANVKKKYKAIHLDCVRMYHGT